MITVKQLELEVRRLANENPDYIYKFPANTTTCRYIDHATNTGSCLFGQALVNLGVPTEEFGMFEGRGITTLYGGLVARGLLEPTPPTEYVEWFAGVQMGQDTGNPWGTAVANADEYTELPEAVN